MKSYSWIGESMGGYGEAQYRCGPTECSHILIGPRASLTKPKEPDAGLPKVIQFPLDHQPLGSGSLTRLEVSLCS